MLGFLQRRRPESPRIAQIRQLVLFSTLSPKELRVIDSLLYERPYLKGEVVFDEGDEGQALYVILSGRVMICKKIDTVNTVVAEMPAGALFGELALLDDAPRTAQVRAAEDCLLAALSRADFETLLETHARIASKIALQLARDLGHKLTAHFVTLESRPL